MKTVRILSLLLCLGMLVLMVASCGDTDLTTTTVTTTSDPHTGVDAPGVGLLNDRTYSDQTCTIWCKRDFGPGGSLYVKEPGVSAVSRAAYKRLQTINQRTGITVERIVSTASGANIGSEDVGYLRNLFASNDPENIPDIVMPGGYTASVLAGEGHFLDLNYDNPYIDLSKDCWQKNINDALSVCGTYYSVSGLFSTNNTCYTFAIFFDKDALAEIDKNALIDTAAADFEDAESLYAWARSGEWTYAKMMALAAAFTGEEGAVTVPGQMSPEDRYGFEFQKESSYGIFMSTGKKYVTGDPENYNIPALMIDDSETMKVLDWLVDNISQKPYINKNTSQGVYFGLGHQALFKMDSTGCIGVYSSLGAEEGSIGTFNFGILPMPKFDYEDRKQESYYCAHNAWFSTLSCIPKNATDTAFSSFVLQLITEMGYYQWDEDVTTIWEAYVQDGLQGRYAPNLADEEMLDLILHSAASDMGEFNVWDGINVANATRGMFNSGDKSWSTWAQSNRGKLDLAIQDMLLGMGLLSYE